jgi:hypothetical protein
MLQCLEGIPVASQLLERSDRLRSTCCTTPILYPGCWILDVHHGKGAETQIALLCAKIGIAEGSKEQHC